MLTFINKLSPFTGQRPKMICRTAVVLIISFHASIGYSHINSGKNYNHTNKSYLGILIPVDPPHYMTIYKHFYKTRTVIVGHFIYQVGTIYGVPVILYTQPFGGESTRLIGSQIMIDHFNMKLLFYPGTSGAHLPPSKMQIGNIVIGTKQVNYGDFYMANNGNIDADEFSGKSSMGKYLYLYINPTLERYAACAATSIQKKFKLPAWINANYMPNKSNIFYFGVQGTSTMWVTNKSFVTKLDHVFHVIDGDGSWYVALAARLANIPFIEISTISNSIYEYNDRGFPKQKNHLHSSQQIAQDISDNVVLQIIKHHGQQLLSKTYNYPPDNPYPAGYYNTPKNSRGILDKCNNNE